MSTVLDVLKGVRPEFDFSVSDLDKSFSISIEGTDIVPENFTNLQSIEKLLRKYGVNP